MRNADDCKRLGALYCMRKYLECEELPYRGQKRTRSSIARVYGSGTWYTGVQTEEAKKER